MGRKPAEFADFPDMLNPGFGPFRAVVRHLVDGDTADFVIDAGFRNYGYHACRFTGINAPEVWRLASREQGIAARDHLAGMISVGAQVRLYTRRDPDSFGRYLVTVTYVRDGVLRCANADMVRDGHAIVREDWGWREVVRICNQLGISTGERG